MVDLLTFPPKIKGDFVSLDKEVYIMCHLEEGTVDPTYVWVYTFQAILTRLRCVRQPIWRQSDQFRSVDHRIANIRFLVSPPLNVAN